ncbi:MAG: hypothetical protein ACOX1P_26705 [Thermoguttaceae bacterium]
MFSARHDGARETEKFVAEGSRIFHNADELGSTVVTVASGAGRARQQTRGADAGARPSEKLGKRVEEKA